MLGKCSNLHQLCIHVVKYIATNCIYQNQRKLFVFLMFLQNWKKRKLSIARSLLEQQKASVTSPMKVTIGPETIVITNLCHYRHFHHHHIPLWVMEASKLWIFCFEGEEKNVEQVWKKIRFYKKCNCIWRFKLDMQDLLTEMNKNGSLFTPRYVRKIIQISPWPLRFLRSDPWDIGKLGVDGQGPSSFSVPRPLHTSLTSSSSSHYLSTFISPTLSSSSSRIVIKPVFYGKIN